MSEEVTPVEVESIMCNVVAEENYSIARTFYQIRKKNYIINCDFIQDVLGPMMRSRKLFRTNADIKIAAHAWANPGTRAAAEITYGHISDWETSQVTNMESYSVVTPGMEELLTCSHLMMTLVDGIHLM